MNLQGSHWLKAGCYGIKPRDSYLQSPRRRHHHHTKATNPSHLNLGPSFYGLGSFQLCYTYKVNIYLVTRTNKDCRNMSLLVPLFERVRNCIPDQGEGCHLEATV